MPSSTWQTVLFSSPIDHFGTMRDEVGQPERYSVRPSRRQSSRMSVYLAELISRSDRPIQTPFGQTVLLREDNERLLERLGLNALKPTLLDAGFCEGRETRWDLAIANFEAISGHLRW
jgi:hypothetical protein